MKRNPAREKYLPLLSPYVDGELTPEERAEVEQHLANNPESAKQVADLRAADGLMRMSLEMQGDDVDWKAFTDGVMARVAKEKLPFIERIRLSLSEMFLYQRGMLVAGAVGALLAVGIAVPLTMRNVTPDGYANSRVEVQTVQIDETSSVRPVVMETEGGDAIIWTVDAHGDDAGKKKKKGGGEESEEEVTGEGDVTKDNTPEKVNEGEL